jgi:hypothetical protein
MRIVIAVIEAGLSLGAVSIIMGYLGAPFRHSAPMLAGALIALLAAEVFRRMLSRFVSGP